jgi:hypothetical protein
VGLRSSAGVGRLCDDPPVRAVSGPLLVLGAVATVAVAAAAVFGALYATKQPAAPIVLVKPCGDRTFGHIRSLVRDASGRWVIRFDPAWFTSGVTANVAAAEDGVVEPGEPVPNDNYRVDEGHRLLTYLVARRARVTVLTRHGDPVRLGATPIGISKLAALVRGEKPIELFEGLDTGVWLRVHVDTVCRIDQQYLP